MRPPVPDTASSLENLTVVRRPYEEYKRICYEVSDLEESFFVFTIVALTLQELFDMADSTAVENRLVALREILAVLQTKKTKFKSPEILSPLIEAIDAEIKRGPTDVQENYRLYEYFCNNIVQQLLIERFVGARELVRF